MSIFRPNEHPVRSLLYEAGAIGVALFVLASGVFLAGHVIAFVVRVIGGAM